MKKNTQSFPLPISDPVFKKADDFSKNNFHVLANVPGPYFYYFPRILDLKVFPFSGDVETGKRISTFTCESSVAGVALTKAFGEGGCFITAGSDRYVRLWDPRCSKLEANVQV